MTPQSPLAIFLVRAWSEEDRLYARIICSLDINDEPQTKHITADPDEVVQHLRAWLLDLGKEAGPAEAPMPPPDVPGLAEKSPAFPAN